MKTLIVALMASLALLMAPQAQASERSYIYALDSEGIPYATPQKAISAGYAICDAIDRGNSLGMVMRVAERAGYTPYQAGYITGAAISGLCPRHQYLVDRFMGL